MLPCLAVINKEAWEQIVYLARGISRPTPKINNAPTLTYISQIADIQEHRRLLLTFGC